MRKLAGLAVASLLLAACQDGPTTAESSRHTATATAMAIAPAQNESYIVVFRQSASGVPELARALAAAHGTQPTHTYVNSIHGFAARLSAASAESLRRHGDVAYVEQDMPMQIVSTQSPATWGLDRIDQIDLPLNNSYSYTSTGAGVNAYILDTGIRTSHVEFGGRATGVFTAISDGNGTNDCNGHGTHVAGTVGGSTYGVAKSVKLYAVRVLDCTGSGSTSSVIAGVDWVSGNAIKPAVANMSLGGGISTALDQAVANSISSGVTYAVAAGNSNADACNSSPGRVPTALTVGATTTTDARASFSNFGTCLDIFAPGAGITSAYNGSDTQTAVISGTSMASPHVAGVAALYLETQPTATASAVAAALLGVAGNGKVSLAGTGSPNKLLFASFAPPPVDNPPVAAFTYSCPTLTCQLDASPSTDDGTIVSYSWDLGRYPDPTATGKLVSVSYAHNGTRIVTLTVTDNSGKTNSITKTLTVP